MTLFLKHKNILKLAIILSVFFGFFLGFNNGSVSAATVTCNVSLSGFSYNFSDCISTLDSTKDFYYTFKFKRGNTSNDMVFFSDASGSSQRFSQFFDFGHLSALGPNYSQTVLNTGVFTDSYSSTGHHYNRLISYNGDLSASISDVSLTVSDDSLGSCPSPSGSLNVNENGTFDVSNYAEVVIDVPQDITEIVEDPISNDFQKVFFKIVENIIPAFGILLVVWFGIDMLSSLIFGRGR